MILTIHHSTRVLERRNYQIRFEEYAFAPLAYADMRSMGGPEGWRHYRVASRPIDVEVPEGSRVVVLRREEFRNKTIVLPAGDIWRLITFENRLGLCAESVFNLARKGERGFKMAREVAA